MKKYSYFLIILALAVACSPRKNTFVNRNYQNFYAYYNTLFNSKDALESELNTRKNSHQDNFYQPYIKLLTFDNDHEVESEKAHRTLKMLHLRQELPLYLITLLTVRKECPFLKYQKLKH